MKTADKKRILSTPTVKGELLITTVHDGIKKFDFRCCYNTRQQAIKEWGTLAGIILTEKKREETRIHLNAEQTHIELWIYAASAGSIKLSQRIKYSDIAILWCVCDGISDCRQEFNKAIAA